MAEIASDLQPSLAHHLCLSKGEILKPSKYPVDQFSGQYKEAQEGCNVSMLLPSSLLPAGTAPV